MKLLHQQFEQSFGFYAMVAKKSMQQTLGHTLEQMMQPISLTLHY
jgi:hypothetical protein